MWICWAPALAAGDSSTSYEDCLSHPHDVRLRIETEMGAIDAELYGTRAPITVCNFLRYLRAGLFDGGQFVRTVRPENQGDKPVKISVIQADIRDGGKAFAPIPMERTVTTTIHHVDGAISMPRGDPDTATSGFFISVGDQPSLDFGGKRNPDGQGFAAFGRVIRGMDAVKHIWAASASGEKLTPPILISRVRLLSGERSEQR